MLFQSLGVRLSALVDFQCTRRGLMLISLQYLLFYVNIFFFFSILTLEMVVGENNPKKNEHVDTMF